MLLRLLIMTISDLPSRLFWDTDIESIDLKENARFIINRVISKGSVSDWKKIKNYYGIKIIRNEILKIRNLDSKTFNFFHTYFNLDKSQFRCYSNQQLNPGHFNY